MKSLALACICWLMALPLFAQTQPALYGRVTDKKTGEALAGATIKVKDASGNVVRGAKSNSEGRYRIALPMGRYVVEVSYLGYKTQIEQVAIALPLEKNFALSEGEVRSAEIVVDAGEDLVTTIMKRAIR
ncbi:MAG: carboxypeptidase-like regulatory domain-containing protein [Candidatus Thermochlorobacter sp.]